MWSARQQSMLHAMGYTLYARPHLSIVPASAETPVTQTAGATGLPDSGLFRAIVKAAQGRDVSQLAIDLNALRSPQAKRALWPQLRKLMKS